MNKISLPATNSTRTWRKYPTTPSRYFNQGVMFKLAKLFLLHNKYIMVIRCITLNNPLLTKQ